MRRSALCLCLLVATLVAPAGADAAARREGGLQAGVGRADVTPPKLGYYLGGWTRADRLALGQRTRLFAKAVALEQGARKQVLVSLDLFQVPAGMTQEVAQRSGLTEQELLITVTHTHSGPGGYAPYSTYNTAAPSIETLPNPESFTDFFLSPAPVDKQLYTFLVEQTTKAVARAQADLAPAAAAWGAEELTGLTENRSLEAHLNDHGIKRAFDQGKPEEDPDGARHTIDPDVDVLRVDQLVRRRGKAPRRRPIGAFSSFANHGTVVKAEFQAYDGDHHATAQRLFEQRVRASGKVPSGQDVVNVFGASNEGDQTSGLDHTGPAGADHVGQVEAEAMLRAWKAAGRRLSRRFTVDARWARSCFCGRMTAAGPVDDQGQPGVPFLTGSEEGRGPLFDITKQPFEGRVGPEGTPEQGHKLAIPLGDFPTAVPFQVVRLGDRALASIPAEPTKEVGARVEAAVGGVLARTGVKRVVTAGLTNDYLSYFVTPEEYDRQHYEGGSTMFGRATSVFAQERLVDLAQALAAGRPAPASDPFDPTNGVKADGPAYGQGAERGAVTAQPAGQVARLTRAEVRWQGGPSGTDRPVDAPFIRVERRKGSRWAPVTDDLGVQILWRSDAEGRAFAQWEVPRDAAAGAYRLVVTASRYRLVSDPFTVVDSTALQVVPAGAGTVRVDHPPARENVDLTARPASIEGGTVTFRVDGRDVPVRSRGGSFAVPAGGSVTVPAGGARDRFGNTNATAVTVR